MVLRLEKALNDARNNREWRYEYMTLLMRGSGKSGDWQGNWQKNR